MTPILTRWFGRSNERLSSSYDFAENIPVWKTWWFKLSAGALCVGIAVFWIGWI
jgi:hypothetical protein